VGKSLHIHRPVKNYGQIASFLKAFNQKVFSMNRATKDVITNSESTNNGGIRIYHERQSKQLCALHALNNLFQSPKAFTKHELDSICKELAPDARIFNPHRSFLGLGCYDVNVIIAALGKKGYDVVWFDKRK
jgi:hypothetical protein